MQTPDESRGYARGVGGGEENGDPALSVHVASTWMHPSLSEMDALPPPSPSPPTTQWWGGDARGWGWGGGCSQPPSCFAADGAKQPPSCFAADGAKQPPSCFAADGAKQPPSCFAADGYGGGSPRTLSSMMRGGPNMAPWGLQGGLGGGFAIHGRRPRIGRWGFFCSSFINCTLSSLNFLVFL
nr:hypothetical protein [Morchella crassipes]